MESNPGIFVTPAAGIDPRIDSAIRNLSALLCEPRRLTSDECRALDGLDRLLATRLREENPGDDEPYEEPFDPDNEITRRLNQTYGPGGVSSELDPVYVAMRDRMLHRSDP